MARTATLAALITTVILVLTPLAPASAQCRLCAAPTTQVATGDRKDQVELEIDTSLSFDRLILYGAGDGTALLRPDGSSSSAGTVADISPRAFAGTVTVHGEPG